MYLVLDAQNEGRIAVAATFDTLAELKQWRSINPSRPVFLLKSASMPGGYTDVEAALFALANM